MVPTMIVEETTKDVLLEGSLVAARALLNGLRIKMKTMTTTMRNKAQLLDLIASPTRIQTGFT
jgi:hypothetical protein